MTSCYTRTCTASGRIQRTVRCSRQSLVANALAGNAVMIGNVPRRDKRKSGRLCNGLIVGERSEESVVVVQQIRSFVTGIRP